jgi:hypothetical protein
MEMNSKLAEVPVGQLCMMQERISDGRGNDEWREVYYRRTDQLAKHPHFVGIARLGIVQGDPNHAERGDLAPRYVRMLSEPCVDPGEADGRTVVLPLSMSLFPSIAPQS